MPKLALNTKRIQLDKTNTSVVVTAGVAAFLVIFCLVATKTFISQAAYQGRIISAKSDAASTLKSNVAAARTLQTSYNKFIAQDPNMIGGSATGSGARDGNNGTLTLAALPSSYDFPALTSSIEKLVTSQGLQINSLTGTDAGTSVAANGNPTPQPIPFSVSVSGGYNNMGNLLTAFQSSIRPFQVQKLQLTGGKTSLTMTVTGQTYYQAGKTLDMKTKVIQ